MKEIKFDGVDVKGQLSAKIVGGGEINVITVRRFFFPLTTLVVVAGIFPIPSLEIPRPLLQRFVPARTS